MHAVRQESAAPGPEDVRGQPASRAAELRTAAAWDSPSSLPPAGPRPAPSKLAGGWKDASMVVRYAASVATRDGAVSGYMR